MYISSELVISCHKFLSFFGLFTKQSKKWYSVYYDYIANTLHRLYTAKPTSLCHDWNTEWTKSLWCFKLSIVLSSITITLKLLWMWKLLAHSICQSTTNWGYRCHFFFSERKQAREFSCIFICWTVLQSKDIQKHKWQKISATRTWNQCHIHRLTVTTSFKMTLWKEHVTLHSVVLFGNAESWSWNGENI